MLDGLNSTFQLKKDVPLPPLQNNQVLLQSIYFSIDPAQRTLIWNDYPSGRDYTNLMKEGGRMRAYRVVIDSRSELFKIGQLVIASPGRSLYAVVDASACHPINRYPALMLRIVSAVSVVPAPRPGTA